MIVGAAAGIGRADVHRPDARRPDDVRRDREARRTLGGDATGRPRVGGEVDLDVGPVLLGVAAGEGADLERAEGHRALPGHEVADEIRYPTDAPEAAVEPLGADQAVGHREREVVPHVLADERAVVHDRDAEALEPSAVADAGELEQLRRHHRATREDDLPGRPERHAPAPDGRHHTRGSPALEQDALDERTRAHDEVRPLADRVEERRRRALAVTPPDRVGVVADADEIGMVQVLPSRQARLGAGFDQRFRQRVAERAAGDVQRPACAPVLVGAELVILDRPCRRRASRPSPSRRRRAAPSRRSRAGGRASRSSR